ncbi:MAG TPA: hypothetical protein VM925_04580 [Labilithrix sp.]|nr:hypothetical protein [Labilithrix sp.]
MRSFILLAGVLIVGCKGAASNVPTSRAAPTRATTCASITAHLVTFGEELETSSTDAKTRALSYPGRLELLLSFEDAVSELDDALGRLRPDRELDTRVARA